MERRLVVSTECPECGAPLDFAEGSNAVRCGYCRSNLLVTGRKQVLSYYVDPVVEPRDAARIAWTVCREKGGHCRAVRWERYFVPYYRFTAQDLRWERGEAPAPKEKGSDPKLRLERAAIELRFAAAMAAAAPQALSRSAEAHAPGVLRDRYVDKNFVACDLRDAELQSLGIRLAVLKLRLFHSEKLRSLGRIVAPVTTPEAASARAMQTVSVRSTILWRKVLGPVLSVIYFPFCVVEIERRGETVIALVDGVAGSVVKLNAPAAMREALDRESGGEPNAVEFRPLACPNCGWDLPVRPDDSVFFCKSCERAFQINGRELRRLSHEVAKLAPAREADESEYLPFWVLSDPKDGEWPARFFVPAFRFRRLKILVDLARDMSRQDRSYAQRVGSAPALHGCYYDQDDALALAAITYPGLTAAPDQAIAELDEKPLDYARTTLTWFPFSREGRSLRDPFTGRALNENLLL